jgi:hypothetical protein
MRVGAVAAGTAITGTALFGAAQLGGLHPAQLLEPAHADVALTSSAASGLDLTALLNDITIDVNGSQVPLGEQTLDTVLQYGFPDLGSITMSQLLGDLGLSNGLNTTVTGLLDTLQLGSLQPITDLLSPLGLTGTSDLDQILANIDVGGSPIGNITLDSLLADFTPSGDSPLSDATTLGTLLTDFPSLADLQLPEIPLLGGLLGTPTLSELVTDLGYGSTTLGSLLDFTSTTDLTNLVDEGGLGSTTINTMLGDLGTMDGVTLSSTSTVDDLADFLGLGSQTLGELIPGGLTNTSTLLDLVGDTAIFGSIGTETIDALFGGM